MNDRLFVDLRLPRPDHQPGSRIGLARRADRRGDAPLRAGARSSRPSCVLVVGDVNSTLACTLVAVKKGVPVAHVEAGLRSFDRSMPEEINRVLTDQIADLLYTTERAAHDNLAREGIDASRAHFVGNVMIDSLLANRALAIPPRETMRRGGFDAVRFRCRRSGSVWSRCIARRTSTARTRWVRCSPCCAMSASGCRWSSRCIRARAPTSSVSGWPRLVSGTRMAVLPPQGYLEMLGLMSARTLWCSPTPAACRRKPRRSACRASRCARIPSARSPSSRGPTRSSAGTGARSCARSTRFWRAGASADACRSSGTGAPPSGSPRISPTGSSRRHARVAA